MNRNLFRLTLGLAALGVVLVGLESQADARGRRCGGHHRHNGCHSACNSSCHNGGCHSGGCHKGCEAPCEEVKDCGGKSDCGGCQSDCGGKKHCGHRHKCRRHRGGCDSGCNGGGCGGCNGGGCGGCNGGKVIHEGAPENGQSAPSPPPEEAPSA